MKSTSTLGWQRKSLLTKLTKQTTVLEHLVMVTSSMDNVIDIQKGIQCISFQTIVNTINSMYIWTL